MSGYLDQLLAEIGEPSITRRRKQRYEDDLIQPRLAPEEVESMAMQALGMGGSGLQWLGDTLSKGGRAVRGTLSGLTGGDWGGGPLNLIPFSDTIGLTDPVEQITGQKLLKHWGAIDDEDSWGNWGAGLAVDIITDPLTYLGGLGAGSKGALMPAGKALSKAGGLRNIDEILLKTGTKLGPREFLGTNTLRNVAEHSTIAKQVMERSPELADEILGGAVNFGIPFMKKAVPLSTPGATSVARGLDVTGHALRYGKLGNIPYLGKFLGEKVGEFSPGQYLASQFDSSVGGVMGEREQILRKTIELNKRDAENLARAKGLPVAQSLNDLFPAEQWTDAEIADALENISKRPLSPTQQSMVDTLHELKQERLADDVYAGMKEGEFIDPTNPAKYYHPAGIIEGGDLGQGPLYRAPSDTAALGETISKNPAFNFGVSKTTFEELGKDKILQSLIEKGGSDKDILAYLNAKYAEKIPVAYARTKGMAGPRYNAGSGMVSQMTNQLRSLLKMAGLSDDAIKNIDYADVIDTINNADLIDQRLQFAQDYAKIPANVRAAGVYKNPIVSEVMAGVSHAGERKALDTIYDLLAKVPNTLKYYEESGSNVIPKILNPKGNIPGQLAGGISELPAKGFQDIVPVRRMLGELGVDTEQGARRILEKLGYAEPEDIGQIFMHEGGIDDLLIPPSAASQEYSSLLKDFADKAHIDRNIYEALISNPGSITGPAESSKIMGFVDSITNLFKAAALTRPSFQPRNLGSGQLNNVLTGLDSPSALNPFVRSDMGTVVRGGGLSAAKYLQYADKVQELLKTYKIAPSLLSPADRIAAERLASMSIDDAVAEVARNDMGGFGLVNKYEGQTTGQTMGFVDDLRPGSAKEVLSARPGETEWSWKDVFRNKDWKGIHKIFNVRGVAGRTTTGQPLAALNEEVGHFVESMNRGKPFLNLVSQGFDPVEAAKLAGEAQVQYGSKFYTPFERQVMTRLFPFYKFTKGMGKFLGGELLKNPSGGIAQTIRVTNALKGDEPMPDYLQNTLGIPIPKGTPLIGPEGDDPRYLTGMGMMHEQPAQFLGGGVRGTLGEIGSALNPLVKAPIEWATGKTFFQRGPEGGRELGKLDPIAGRTVANIHDMITGEKTRDAKMFPESLEYLLANTGAAPVVLRQATDPRKNALTKLLGIGTGAKMYDVNEASRDAIMRDAVNALMKDTGAQQYTNTYFPKDDLATMPMASRVKALQLQAIQKALADRAKQRANERKKRENPLPIH